MVTLQASSKCFSKTNFCLSIRLFKLTGWESTGLLKKLFFFRKEIKRIAEDLRIWWMLGKTEKTYGTWKIHIKRYINIKRYAPIVSVWIVAKKLPLIIFIYPEIFAVAFCFLQNYWMKACNFATEKIQLKLLHLELL